MKTKLLLKFFLLSFFVQNSYSQVYYPLLNNSSWNIQISNFTGPQYKWIEQGVDVVIGQFIYKKFIDVDYFQTEILVREDVTNKKVYRRLNNFDVLMLDFSLQVGNSIILGDGNLYSVSSISNINVNGGQRRKFNLIHYNGSFPVGSETWIEGVGNRANPLRPNFELPSDPAYNIRCSYQNGTSVYNLGLENGGTATVCPTPNLSITNENLIEQSVGVFPNPFSNETTLKLEINLQNATLEMFNSIGQKVKEIKNDNSNEINIKRENLVDGIYLLVLKQDGKIIKTKKIVLQN